MSDEPKKNPLREIVQPFIDLVHAPRALWGINLAYVIEGMCYFGVLSYLAIHFSDFVFQSVEHADEYSHNNVMILTAGITIAMFFLGAVADKWGVRFALIAAFVFMLVGRAFLSGAPTVLGLDPPRPGVIAGDSVSLHVTDIDTKDGNKRITGAVVIGNNQAGAGAAGDIALDLAGGEGIAPSRELDSRLVRLDRAKLVSGEGQEWTVEYGSAPTTAQLLIHTAEELGLRTGATISLRRAYVTRPRESEEDDLGVLGKIAAALGRWFGDADSLPEGLERRDDDEFIIGFGGGAELEGSTQEEGEFIIRTHWLEDVLAIDTFPVDLAAGEGIVPDATLESHFVRISEAKLVKGDNETWEVQYGGGRIRGRWFNEPPEALGLCNGATIAINRAQVTQEEGVDFALRFDRHRDMAIVDISNCDAATNGGATSTDKWIPDLSAGDGIALDASLEGEEVQLGEARVARGGEDAWLVTYGRRAVTARLIVESVDDPGLCDGARISLYNAAVVSIDGGAGGLAIRSRWPEDVAAVDTYGCQEPPYSTMKSARERNLRSSVRRPVVNPDEAARDVRRVSTAELLEMDDGPIDVVLPDARVTYVRNGGYYLQSERDGPAIFAFVNPVWSPLHLVTLLGMLGIVIGYGMYQPAAYAGVRLFTTPKTAAMGFAMLYALMNLGGWLPTFAFLLRDEDFLGLGIPGVFWFYTGCTVLALLVTIFILSRRTVSDAIARAKIETAAIEKAEGKSEEKAKEKEKEDKPAKSEALEPSEETRKRVPAHMWVLALAFVLAIYFRVSEPWNLYAGGILSAAWIVCALLPVTGGWIARHPLADTKFFFFIFALIPVQTLFTYNWLILPQYISRAFEGWIGEYFEIAANANPILIFIAVPLIAAATMRAKVYNMMIYGTFIMAAPAFLLVIGPYPWTLACYILIMTIGEAMWQPRFLQYAAEIAPEGRTGQYMGVAQLPWFLTKVLVPWLYSGWMMDRFCPAEGQQDTQTMWFIFACIAMCSTVLLLLAKGWVGKDFKTKAD